MNHTFIISRNEAEYILVAQHDRLIDFGLSKPGALLAAGKYLDRNVFAAPAATPHLAEASFADHLDQLHLTRNGPLHQQRQTGYSIPNSGKQLRISI